MKTKWKIIVTLALVVFFVGIILTGLFLVAQVDYELPFFSKKVAVVPIQGEITTGECSCNILGCQVCAQVEVVKNMLESADNDEGIGAIVLDINSGGGGVIASSEMTRAVRETKKPVVARIGGVGASGAYQVASAADMIVADRNSLTGSIAVVIYLQQYYGLMEKLGLNMTVIKSGKYKDIGSPYRPMEREEEEDFQGMVDDIYDTLIIDIANNRNLSVDYLKNISAGAIYLGSEAKELGLVDELGNLEDAIELAGKLSEIKGRPDIIIFSPRKNLLERLFGR